MPRLIALLRAINVGGHTVKMDHLRRLFEALGLSNVETFIASGNVIFEAPAADPPALEKQIESHLRQSLGYEVTTFIRSTSELAVIAGHRPFPAAELDSEGSSLYIAFLPALPGGESHDRLMALRTEVDDFHIHEREVYWLCRRQLGESSFSGARLEKTLGMPATVRNATTVRRLAAKYPAAS
ncbi:MAG TPA: DUF1697 domain-containing protein [Herpetosiphonaceae bacterium]|nr:DUF1697 domain-containing protein [Herpetosiphonaceae bacterium]